MKKITFSLSEDFSRVLWNVKNPDMLQQPEEAENAPEEDENPLEEAENAQEEAESLEGGNVKGGGAGDAKLGNVERGISNVGNLKQVEYKSVNGRTIEVDVSERKSAEDLAQAHQEERIASDKAKAKLAEEMKTQPEVQQVNQEQAGEEERVEGEKEESMTGVQENADTWIAESGIEEDQDVGVGTNVG